MIYYMKFDLYRDTDWGQWWDDDDETTQKDASCADQIEIPTSTRPIRKKWD